MALADISTESTSRGGTMIGDAIRKAATEVFDQQSREYKDIILITDGEEHEGQESFPVQAAEKAAQEGVRIIAIGLGDENEGSRIPITAPDGRKSFLMYNGEEVWSKLAGNKLREIVFPTGGRFLPVGPGETFNLDQIYNDFIATAQKRELESLTMMKYDEKFQIFLALGIGLIICEALISERKKI
jgi:Ca-activated chloride channel family protein